jgi:glycosyltransferase involved in cell wall biosynthesis
MVEISVLIPTYLRPQMLRRAIESCLAQQGLEAPFEIVVVDNDPLGSARPLVEEMAAGTAVPIRYVAERRPGISRARNTAVANADGQFVVWLDDDEEAAPGWLAALYATMRRHGGDVVKGPVYPRLATPNPYAEKRFTFDAKLPTGARLPECTGIGNTLLDKERCFGGEAEPFDPFLGLAGGGDTLFFRKLQRSGRRFVWCAEAAVWETVPAERLVARQVLRRRFRHGQITTFVRVAVKPAQPMQAALWMAVGCAQVVLYAPVAAALWMVNSERWLAAMGQAVGGLGKVLWHPKWHVRLYRTLLALAAMPEELLMGVVV